MANKTPLIVTLDGPAGVGKSTLARRLAGELGVAFLDTGAMFRAAAFTLGEGSWDLPQGLLQQKLGDFDFTLRGSGADTELLLNGHALPAAIRGEETGRWASLLAVVPSVRAYMKMAQIYLGNTTSLVAEGRDMGTVVFPQATHKFFLDADPEERARRRCRQLEAQGKPADLKAIAESIRQRDDQDRNRSIAPLKPAPDAMVVDTTFLTESEVLEAVLDRVRGLR
ncbi:MAG TPA: (d)CMP kinase [Humidesulfovibrio sp.]|uniref:(d)CMP kinase n=1 Tax=Humidesulfovibrio sp. TaxID=2910988 RepID=UPI002CD8BC97|nr:(d)CMP kinase [Humidesulfovibrio sp.]HWR03463.1 (d)CMP kinase [Humidesulfovibrio sp.]